MDSVLAERELGERTAAEREVQERETLARGLNSPRAKTE